MLLGFEPESPGITLMLKPLSHPFGDVLTVEHSSSLTDLYRPRWRITSLEGTKDAFKEEKS